MRRAFKVFVFVVALVPTLAAAPATQVATPATTLRGHIEIEAGLQKPDFTKAIVYLAADPTLDGPPPQDHYTVAQQNKAFVPNFIVVPKGAQMEFPNWDKYSHNVFSRSAAAPAFDLDRYPCGCSKRRAFDKVGVVQIFCNIHPFMRAIIVVTPNRFAARADADGNFSLGGVPPGKYELVAWHDRCDESRQTVIVGDGETEPVTFQLHETHDAVIGDATPGQRAGYGVERGLGVKREVLHLPVVTEAHPAIDPPPATQP